MKTPKQRTTSKKGEKVYWAIIWKGDTSTGDFADDLEVESSAVTLYPNRTCAMEEKNKQKARGSLKTIPVHITPKEKKL